jgi:hypothetical protein
MHRIDAWRDASSSRVKTLAALRSALRSVRCDGRCGRGDRLCLRPAGREPLSRKVEETAAAVRTERAIDDKAVVRDYAETRHKAKS